MDTGTIVGALAAVASVTSFTPQAWKIIRSRKTEGLSLAMFALTTVGFGLWIAFGILRGEWPIIVPNSICFLLAAFILLMIALPPRKTRAVAEAVDPTS